MKEKLQSKFNIEPTKMIVISNHEEKSFLENFTNNTSQHYITNAIFSITYVGGFGPHRGLDTAIKGMPLILKKIPNAKLFLIGKGSKDVESKLREIVKDNNVESHVNFVGYRPFKEVSAIMKASTINIIPHNADEHTNNTIPHKLFQIMMSKSTLLVSSCKPLKRIVEKYDAGFVFEAENPSDFAREVIKIHAAKEKVIEKVENAYKAVIEKGENWETESLKLIELYDKLGN
jgi:glycosyltransferase involved in cell wall biosynthesis